MYDMIEKSVKKTNTKTIKSRMLLTGLTIFATFNLFADSTVSISKNLFLPRAFSANTAREMMMEGHVITTDFDGFYALFSATGAFQHSWKTDDATGIGALPFWSGTNVMSVGTNTSSSTLDAYQFGLGDVTSNGTITLNPVIYQGGSDFMLYLGASTNDPGMFLKIKAPLGVIIVNPELTESEATAGVSYRAGALSLSTATVADPATTMTQAFAGNLANGQSKNGDFLPMEYGLINGKQSSGAKFGNIEMALGYNIICDDDYLFAIGLRASGPAGNKPKCVYIMEPIFGRGGYWGVGGYVDGNMKLWENHANKSLSLNIMATILHLMGTDTIRSYDLTSNGPGSKYLLVGDFTNSGYQGIIQNLINISTLDSRSTFSAEGDASIRLTYLSNGWNIDLGYNFWGRTKEVLEITGVFPTNTYAILGRQGAGLIATPLVASDLCQPTATIASSDARVDAAAGTVVDATVPSNRISGSSAFDTQAAAQASSSTSKLFTRGSYSWLDMPSSPFVGYFGEFEIGTSANNSLSQWSVGLLGGIYF